MPKVIDYADVQARCGAAGLVSLYPNSGAFGFGDAAGVSHVGWLLGEDASIRPAARAMATVISGDCGTLAERACAVWQTLGDANVLLLPKSHWAYELTFGNGAWLGDSLIVAGVDPNVLADRHDGAAIEFASTEINALSVLLATMLDCLLQSDFELVFLTSRVICTVHHHKQLWWSFTPWSASAFRLSE